MHRPIRPSSNAILMILTGQVPHTLETDLSPLRLRIRRNRLRRMVLRSLYDTTGTTLKWSGSTAGALEGGPAS